VLSVDVTEGVDGLSNDDAVVSLAGMQSRDSLRFSCWSSGALRPAHYVAVDHSRRSIVVSVRGTLTTGSYSVTF
jgi:hypothetical protein